MPYYHNLVTQKSWEELQRLNKTAEFILIGGWAIYLYTKTLKSKDIDILVEFDELAVLAKHYRLHKNERLKKYEAVKGEIQIDIYLPHYSRIGIPVEDLKPHTVNLESFCLLKPEYLLALKVYTLRRRARTPKGRKDFADIVALIQADIVDWQKFLALLDKHKLQSHLEYFRQLLDEYYELPELNLNRHHFSKLKKDFLASCQ
jgi:predicted nucleotidyltransferase